MGSLRSLQSSAVSFPSAEDVQTYNFERLDLSPVQWYSHNSRIQYRLRWERVMNTSTGYIVIESRCGKGPYGWEKYDLAFYHARYKSKKSSDDRYREQTARALFQKWANALETKEKSWLSILRFPHRWTANLLSPFSTATFLNFIKKTPEEVKACEMMR
jgi:hypothetical protein